MATDALTRCYESLAKLPEMDRRILMFPLGAMNDTERGRAAEICEQVMNAPHLRAVVEADAALIAELRAALSEASK